MNDKERQGRIDEIRNYHKNRKLQTTTPFAYATEQHIDDLISEIDSLKAENVKLRYELEEKDRDETERELLRVSKDRDKWMEEHDKMVAKFANKEEDFRVLKEKYENEQNNKREV